MTEYTETRPVRILLVEDNEGDILLTREALKEGKMVNELSVAKDGWEAVRFLEKKGEYASVETPDLILLDINLPKMNGHEVLRYIKSSESLKHIPVVMLTTSSMEKDVHAAYHNHVNCYITKPVEVDSFMKMVTDIEEFWFSIARLPS